MKTIASTVEGLLSVDPFLEEALSKGIINYSALAEHMQPSVSEILRKDVKSGAIMMALRRHQTSNIKFNTSRLKNMLKGMGDMALRSNLCDFTFYNSATLTRSYSDLITQLHDKPNVYYVFTRGLNESTLIISKSEFDLVEDCLTKKETVTHYMENLSAISMTLPKENYNVPGLYYQLFKRLAMENISVYEVVSTTNEFTIVVENQYVDKAFSVMKRLN